MALLIHFQQWKPDAFAQALRALDPKLDLRIWPDTGAVEDIRYALVWKPKPGVLASLPNLEVIFSIGAGVDNVLSDPELPDVPLVRFVDPNLTMRMSEYVCLHVLLHQRRMLEYLAQQKQALWQELWPQPAAAEVRVGVMGLGVLGEDAARKLTMLGFDVAGWSRSQKEIEGVSCFSGDDGLDRFLARSDILVCLLPLTPATRGILNAALFARLARGAALPGPVLINAGRGALQVEEDILAALDDGTLWAASLDVFQEEPLPETSPLWRHERIVITPHNASISDNRAVCAYVLEQIARYEDGKGLRNVVDRQQGY
ncbi:MAG: glyoxylate/hydroxypyruvate reductase A [Alphaproteobacteria bacterium]|nr:MAG: glyoxylate/hydroxypyruvate reductase A [Alphaproteobacteria bacterium]